MIPDKVRGRGKSSESLKMTALISRPGDFFTVRFMLAICIASLCGACSPSHQQIESFIHDWEAPVSAADYRVQPPDELEISSSNSSEIDGEIQTVRQDGKISLRLLGEVQVADLTPSEISTKLESLLAQYYVNPQVNVRLSHAMSKKYYVFGQVGREGAFPFTGRDTLLTAIAHAKPLRIAATDQIKVIRPSQHSDKRSYLTVDADRMMKEGKMDQNLLLQENDIVYVPPTVIGWIGLKFQEILFPISSSNQIITTPYNTANTVNNGVSNE